jgi:NitT/TauT family transport system permease protein
MDKLKPPSRSIFRQLFYLNQPMKKSERLVLSLILLIAFMGLWQFFFPAFIPKFMDIWDNFLVMFFEQGLVYELGMTIKLVLKGMFFSLLIAFAISYLGEATNFFKPIARVFPYFRFWSMYGFQPIIRVVAGDGDTYRLYLIMFAIVPFMVTGLNTILYKVKEDPLYDYARTMGLPEWKCFWYVVIRNRLLGVYLTIRTNFAIAWLVAPAVEIANRDGGGIGAMLYDKARFVPGQGESAFAAAFAVQFVVLGCGVLLDYLFRKLILTLPEERIKTKGE